MYTFYSLQSGFERAIVFFTTGRLDIESTQQGSFFVVDSHLDLSTEHSSGIHLHGMSSLSTKVNRLELDIFVGIHIGNDDIFNPSLDRFQSISPSHSFSLNLLILIKGIGRCDNHILEIRRFYDCAIFTIVEWESTDRATFFMFSNTDVFQIII